MMIQFSQQMWEMALLALVLWREARGEAYEVKRVVAWSIRNRVLHPSWWGKTWEEVITRSEQYSSITHAGDANLVKFPAASDATWVACMDIAFEVYSHEPGKGVDVSQGSTHYFDKSLDGTSRVPKWATDGSMVHVMDAGNFHFFKAA